MDSSYRKVIAYIGDYSDVIRKSKDFERAQRLVARKFGQEFAQSIVKVGKAVESLKKIDVLDPKTGRMTTKRIRELSQEVTFADGKTKMLTVSSSKLGRSVTSMGTSLKGASVKTVSLGENFARLAKRALLTIPVWFTIRNVMGGTFRVMKDGIKALADMDKALQKARRNLQATSSNVEQDFKTLREEATTLSIKTGISVDKIINAFQKFATVGFSTEASLSGMTSATKLAVLLFGDAEDTAKAFARAMKVLVSDFGNSKKSAKEIEDVMALTAELWQTNAFEIDELSQGMEKFSGTAKSMGFTARETVTLLAALSSTGLNANRAGTLLRTSVQKLEGNLDELVKVLGIQVNPEVDRTFDLFIKVTNAIAKLKSEAGTISPAITEAIQELFGGVRGGEPIRNLVADIKEVNKTLQTYVKTSSDINKFNNEVEEQNKQLYNLIEQYHNLNKEIGKAFVTGITGAEDFNESMQKIVSFQTSMVSKIKEIGDAIRNEFVVPEGFINTFSKLAERGLTGAKIAQPQALVTGVIQNKLKKGLVSLTEFLFGKKSINSANAEIEKQTQALIDRMRSTFETKLEDKPVKVPIELTTPEKLSIAQAVMESQLKQLGTLGATESQLLKATNYLTDQLGIYEKEEDYLKRQLKLQQAINEEKKMQNKLSSDAIKLFEIATGKEEEKKGSRFAGINLAEAMKPKAKTTGPEIAKAIADVLMGRTSFETFVRQGGPAVDTFKKEFEDRYKQAQAEAYFKGNRVPGIPEARGGFGIGLDELEMLRRGVSSYSGGAFVEQKRAEDIFLAEKKRRAGATTERTTKGWEFYAPVSIMNSIIIEDFDLMAEKVINEVRKELPKVGSGLNKALRQAIIGNVQTNAL